MQNKATIVKEAPPFNNSHSIDSAARTLIHSSVVRAIPRSFHRRFSREQILKVNKHKRIFDLILCTLGAPFVLILFPLIALGIKLSSNGPVFFLQERLGKDGEPFMCYKFRTMHEKQATKEDGKPNITIKGDNRIFWFGQLLRNSNLDELPQLLNVVKGDMSLVGPRPYMTVEAEYWEEEFDDIEYALRRVVKPGLTGLAQVNGYRGGILDKEHMRVRLHYDLLYVKSYQLSLDAQIIGKTILQMIKRDTDAH